MPLSTAPSPFFALLPGRIAQAGETRSARRARLATAAAARFTKLNPAVALERLVNDGQNVAGYARTAWEYVPAALKNRASAAAASAASGAFAYAGGVLWNKKSLVGFKEQTMTQNKKATEIGSVAQTNVTPAGGGGGGMPIDEEEQAPWLPIVLGLIVLGSLRR